MSDDASTEPEQAASRPALAVHARVITTRAELESVARALRSAPRLGLDVEADGMFAYRAQICTVQIAAAGEAFLVDALATPLEPLAELLGDGGPVKVIHDVAFDARMLAAAGVPLGNVHDTAIAARMLARPATGLAKLALSELGVTVDKSLQHHDWRERPLLPAHVEYLARDVLHLEALADALWREIVEREIEAEVLEETRYRVACANDAAREPENPVAYADAKGFDRLAPLDRAVFRRLWRAREDAAAELDVPSGRLVATEALLALARSRPRGLDALAKSRVARDRLETVGASLLKAITVGIADGELPAEHRALLDVPRPPREAIARRAAREAALTAWRKTEAARRKVDEQVVLPGHCLKALAEPESMEVGTIQASPGFGLCRAPYAPEIATILQNTRMRTPGSTTETG